MAEKNLPLIHIQQDTALMIAEYHEKADHEDDYDHWKRLQFVLATVDAYNDGRIGDGQLRLNLEAAFEGALLRIEEMLDDDR